METSFILIVLSWVNKGYYYYYTEDENQTFERFRTSWMQRVNHSQHFSREKPWDYVQKVINYYFSFQFK
jgi:ammonia channel protein AmtB